TYTETVNKSLEDSIHNPHNQHSTKDKNDNSNDNNKNPNSNCRSNKGKDPDRNPSSHASNMEQLNKQALADMASAANSILGQLTFLSDKLNNWCQMMSNMDQRISRIEKLIDTQVDPNFSATALPANQETPVSNPNTNQV